MSRRALVLTILTLVFGTATMASAGYLMISVGLRLFVEHRPASPASVPVLVIATITYTLSTWVNVENLGALRRLRQERRTVR